MKAIEAAARAMFARQVRQLTTPLRWDDLGPKAREGYLLDAKVALEAAGQVP